MRWKNVPRSDRFLRPVEIIFSPRYKISTVDVSPDSISSLSSSSYTAREVTSIQWTPNSIMESSLTSALTQLRLLGNLDF